MYIAVKDDKAKSDAERKLAELMAKKEQFASLGIDITIDNATTYLSGFKAVISDISEMTLLVKAVLNATTPGGTLTQAGLDTYIASFSALQTKASTISSSITSQVNNIDTFVTTYKDNQSSLAKQIESMETQIAVSKKQIEESSENASYNLLQSKNNLDFVASTKDENLQSLRNSLGLAQVSYEEAQFNLGKFAIKAPIPGTVHEVLVDDGQEVSPGTPLIRMVGK